MAFPLLPTIGLLPAAPLYSSALVPGTQAPLVVQERPAIEARLIRGPMVMDGPFRPEAWGGLPSHAGFLQREPNEGAIPTNDTEVWIVHDEEALYVRAVLHDDSPETIAKAMTRRDASLEGHADYFEVLIDPNFDRRTGYRFRVSAANVQADSYLFDDIEEDEGWDAVWESVVELHAGGWTVHIRVPFSQIRYDSSREVQTWGLNLGRWRAVGNEHSQFALESRLRPGRVSQFGLLRGVRPPRSGRRAEVRPYTVASVRAAPAHPENPFFDGREATFRVGVDLRYGIGSAFTLDATVNPDFGQVEADPRVISLSESETFVGERRPFFVEDARIFDFSLGSGADRLFYSRRIGRSPQIEAPRDADFVASSEAAAITGAAKLTGRTSSGLSIGALAAATAREWGRAHWVQGEDTRRFLAEPGATHAVVRVRQDARDGQTTVGIIGTGLRRRLPGDGPSQRLSSASVAGGLDFEHAWSERAWAVSGFVAATHVYGDSAAMIRIQEHPTHYRQRPDLEWGAFDSTATSLSGLQWELAFHRRAGPWTGSVRMTQIGSGFEANDLGFTSSRERIEMGGEVVRQEVNPGALFRDYSVAFYTSATWSNSVRNNLWSWSEWWDRSRPRSRLGVRATGMFLNSWSAESQVRHTSEAISRGSTRGGPGIRDPGDISWALEVATDQRRALAFRPWVEVVWGREGMERRVQGGLGVTLQPAPRLRFELDLRADRRTVGDQYLAVASDPPFDPTYGSRYLFADLKRREVSAETRMNLAFTPRTSLEFHSRPLLSAGHHLSVKQLEAPGTLEFRTFDEGVFVPSPQGARCSGGRMCRESHGAWHVDLVSDGFIDFSFPNPDFNVRFLSATAVFRWEHQPGSTFFLVWQRRQGNTLAVGDFRFRRDLRALATAPADDVFIIKANLWVSF